MGVTKHSLWYQYQPGQRDFNFIVHNVMCNGSVNFKVGQGLATQLTVEPELVGEALAVREAGFRWIVITALDLKRDVRVRFAPRQQHFRTALMSGNQTCSSFSKQRVFEALQRKRRPSKGT